ncbi:MAG: peptide chain release factor N(5)-glutamine methyltransferase [Patescibacteria group bacterium]|jgi:release factor glutamine methyltransferase
MPRQTVGSFFQAPSIDPREVRDLLAFVLRKNPAHILAHPEKLLTLTQMSRLKKAIRQRMAGMPFAYIIGTQPFAGFTVRVTPAVLIPRPETEELLERIISDFAGHPPKTIAEIGTGSGCLVIGLAKAFPNAKVVATDISAAALRVARTNARLSKVHPRVQFRHGSLTAPLQPNEQFDVIVANLPYLTPAETQKLTREPKLALLGGKNGDKLLRTFLTQCANRKYPSLYLEVGPQHPKLLQTFIKRLGYAQTTINDAANRPRFLHLTWRG